MGRLQDKIAVITGATSGIGEATALMFAKEGAKVVVVGRNEANGKALEESIIAQGGDALFFKCDVRNPDEIIALKEVALQKYGRVDVLFNSAGVLVHKPFLEQNMDDLNLIFETNFRSYVLAMQAFIPSMLEQGKGSIINVASISSIWPELNSYFYGAMKAAVTNLSRNVAKEFARQGIRVNCILPGPVLTNMTPDFVKNNVEAQKGFVESICMLNRIGAPNDIAYGATYLASDESEWVTGTNLTIDGGVCISN